jgi:lipopolysaccharide export system ATP-binding protein
MLTTPAPDEWIKKAAGFRQRLFAGLVDFLFSLALYCLLSLGVVEYLASTKSDILLDVYWQVIPGFFLFLFLWGLFLECLPIRTTLGKRLFHAKVYGRGGNDVGPKPILLRNLAKLLTWLTAGAGLVPCLFRKDRLSLHDLISGTTIVILEKRRIDTSIKDRQTASSKDKLAAIGLVKIYGGMRVVNGINLEIRPGEVVGLLGPNGAGKTTTFYMIVGLIKPDDGQILIDGEDVSLRPMYFRARRGLNYLPQEPSIFRKLTVEENILAILETLDLTKQERKERLAELLRELDLTPLAKNRAYSLSGGERRRVEITRALVTSPKYILLDEPFAGIDPLAVADIQNIIGKLKAKGIGVVISDHNVRETLSVCDRAYIVNEGSILVEGDPDTISRSEIARKIYFGENFSLESAAIRKEPKEEKMVLSYDGGTFQVKDNSGDK